MFKATEMQMCVSRLTMPAVTSLITEMPIDGQSAQSKCQVVRQLVGRRLGQNKLDCCCNGETLQAVP